MLDLDWRSSVVHIRELFYDFCERHIVFIGESSGSRRRALTPAGVQLVLLTIGAALLLREDTKQRTAARQRLADTPSAKPKMAFQVSKDLKLDPPKDDPISPEELAQHDGSDPSKAIWVAIKGASDASDGRVLMCDQGRSSTSARRGICTGLAAATTCVALVLGAADSTDLRRQRRDEPCIFAADATLTARGDWAGRRSSPRTRWPTTACWKRRT